MSLIMTVPPALPPKKEVANALLQGPSVYVHLDPRRDGVTVPNWFKNQPQLVLQLGLNMALPIHDLDVSDDGISGTLSFNRRPFWCMLPWTAVFGLVGEDGRGMIWPEDVPTELAAQHQRPSLRVVSDKKNRKKPKAVDPNDAALPVLEEAPPSDRPIPPLALVDESPDAHEDDGAAEKPKLPPYLRVIK